MIWLIHIVFSGRSGCNGKCKCPIKAVPPLQVLFICLSTNRLLWRGLQCYRTNIKRQKIFSLSLRKPVYTEAITDIKIVEGVLTMEGSDRQVNDGSR